MSSSSRGKKIAKRNSVLILKNASPVRELSSKMELLPEEEMKMMETNFSEQCSQGDTFWGVDLERRQMLDNLDKMSREDEISNDNRRHQNMLKMRREWENEHKMAEGEAAREEALAEQRMRQSYLAAFFSNASSTPIMETMWRPGNNNSTVQVDIVSGGKKYSKNEDQTFRLPTFAQSKSLFHDVGLQQARTLEEDRSTLEMRGSDSNFDVDASSMQNAISDAIDQRKFLLQDMRRMKKLAEEIMHGHPLYQWDQEVLLRESFDALDYDKSGSLTASKLCKVAKNEAVKKYLRYTVFGPFIKRRQWRAFLEVLLQESGSPEQSYSDSISLEHFYEVALDLSQETRKPLQKIKTHSEYYAELSSPSENKVFFAEQFRSRNSVSERDLRVFEELHPGDVVWSLYKDGSMWLPAVIMQVHDDCTYDLRYPMTQEELRQSRKFADGNKILRGHTSSSQQKADQRGLRSLETMLKLRLQRSNQRSEAELIVQKAKETGDENVIKAVSTILGYNL